MNQRFLSIVELQELFNKVPKWEIIEGWAYFDDGNQHVGIDLLNIKLRQKAPGFFDIIKDKVWLTIFIATGDFHIAVL